MPEDNLSVDQRIDITAEICPMTFVLVRLALDQMQPGQILEVLLLGDEPCRNVPKTATEQGHEVLSQTTTADGRTVLRLRKSPQAA
jgi:TusA-related sulfurtransferase